MDIKNPNKIKFKENEDVRTSFKLKGKGVQKNQLVVLTDKRIYLAGANKSGFMKKSFGVFFANLDSIIAGRRSKTKSGWPWIFIIIFALVGVLLFSIQTIAGSVEAVADMLESNESLVESAQSIGIGAFVLAGIFFFIAVSLTKKSIALDYGGKSELILPMAGKSEEEINSYLDIIADGIDGM